VEERCEKRITEKTGIKNMKKQQKATKQFKLYKKKHKVPKLEQ